MGSALVSKESCQYLYCVFVRIRVNEFNQVVGYKNILQLELLPWNLKLIAGTSHDGATSYATRR
jgi:hypothetical protein